MAVAGEAGKEEEEPHCDVMEALTGCWGVGRANLVVWRDGAGQNCQRVASVEEERAGEKKCEVTRYSDEMPGEMKTKQNQENNKPPKQSHPLPKLNALLLFCRETNKQKVLPQNCQSGRLWRRQGGGLWGRAHPGGRWPGAPRQADTDGRVQAPAGPSASVARTPSPQGAARAEWRSKMGMFPGSRGAGGVLGAAWCRAPCGPRQQRADTDRQHGQACSSGVGGLRPTRAPVGG